MAQFSWRGLNGLNGWNSRHGLNGPNSLGGLNGLDSLGAVWSEAFVNEKLRQPDAHTKLEFGQHI